MSAEELARDSADLARLAAYARKLDADIVAFQEVENEAIAREVFRGYRICMADGTGVQHVGFAVRPRVTHRCGPMRGFAVGGWPQPQGHDDAAHARGAANPSNCWSCI